MAIKIGKINMLLYDFKCLQEMVKWSQEGILTFKNNICQMFSKVRKLVLVIPEQVEKWEICTPSKSTILCDSGILPPNV